MKTSFQRMYTEDNLELCGLLYEPDAGSKKVLVHVHGMTGNFYENKFLDHIAKTLTDNGVAFFAFNNRGTELIKDMYMVENGVRTVVRKGNAYEKFEECTFDIKAALDFVSSGGYTEIHLSGHSLGGPKVAYYIAKTKDSRVASIIFLSPADMVGLAQADTNYESDRAAAKKLVSDGKGNDIVPFMLWDSFMLSADSYMSLTSADSEVAIFNFHDSKDELATLSAVTVPCLTMLGRKDDVLVVPIEELMARVEKALTSSPRVETIILGDANHGFIGHEQELADALNSWIQEYEN